MAEDAQGKAHAADHRDAVRFCAVGAVHRATLAAREEADIEEIGESVLVYSSVLNRFRQITGNDMISEFNDDVATSAEQVAVVFDQIVEQIEMEEASVGEACAE
jgi:hypothetical protein